MKRGGEDKAGPPGRVLIPEGRIRERVRDLGRALAEELRREVEAEGADVHGHDDRIVLIPIMTGAMIFAADLLREMPLRLSIRLMTVSSYAGATTESRGAQMRGALPSDLGGRHVVVIDDILDSGRTLGLVREAVSAQGPASLRFCVLLDKPARRVNGFRADHVGFEIEDEFVVGYGLDYDGHYRNLPEIVVLDPEPGG